MHKVAVQSISERLNQECFCITLDRDALCQALERAAPCSASLGSEKLTVAGALLDSPKSSHMASLLAWAIAGRIDAGQFRHRLLSTAALRPPQKGDARLAARCSLAVGRKTIPEHWARPEIPSPSDWMS